MALSDLISGKWTWRRERFNIQTNCLRRLRMFTQQFENAVPGPQGHRMARMMRDDLASYFLVFWCTLDDLLETSLKHYRAKILAFAEYEQLQFTAAFHGEDICHRMGNKQLCTPGTFMIRGASEMYLRPEQFRLDWYEAIHTSIHAESVAHLRVLRMEQVDRLVCPAFNDPNLVDAIRTMDILALEAIAGAERLRSDAEALHAQVDTIFSEMDELDSRQDR